MYRLLSILLVAALATSLACSGEDPSSNDPDPDVGIDDVDDVIDELSLESVYPVRGSAEGGETVNLYGTGFDEEAEVHFDAEAAQVTFVSSTELEVLTPGGEPGSVSVTVENPDGEQSVLADAYEYVEGDEPDPEYTVGWCTIQYPESTTTEVDVASEPIFGRVYVEGCTDEDVDCPDLHAELGWGEGDTDQWDWHTAHRNMDHDGDNNYEFEGTITSEEAGTFAYAYRFAIDGDDWTYCDLDGSDDGFDLDRAGELLVEEEGDDPVDTVEIGWCTLQHPESTSVLVGDETELIFGRVYVEDCTGIDQHCDLVTAQLGVGPVEGNPTDDADAYTWIDADYNPGHNEDNNDEHQASFQTTDDGSFSYLFRFSGDDGDSWTYCDLDGSDDGFDPDRMGELLVNEPT